jgi:hypothetical protein
MAGVWQKGMLLWNLSQASEPLQCHTLADQMYGASSRLGIRSVVNVCACVQQGKQSSNFKRHMVVTLKVCIKPRLASEKCTPSRCWRLGCSVVELSMQGVQQRVSLVLFISPAVRCSYFGAIPDKHIASLLQGLEDPCA